MYPDFFITYLPDRSATTSLFAGAWLAMAGGCATSSSPTTENGTAGAAFVACEAPRPEACAMHYDPVCGALQGGGNNTYSNGCVACSAHEVTGYWAGACDADAGSDVHRR